METVLSSLIDQTFPSIEANTEVLNGVSDILIWGGATVGELEVVGQVGVNVGKRLIGRPAKAFAGNPHITVLGKVGEYEQYADKLSAKYFHIADDVWNRMSRAERWAANKAFLDEAVASGQTFELSHPVSNIAEESGFFRDELVYLKSLGYELSEDGTQMVRLGPLPNP